MKFLAVIVVFSAVALPLLDAHKVLQDLLNNEDEGSYKERGLDTPFFAFSASLSRTRPVSLGTLVFDKVYINLGQGYNMANGRFTANIHGVYVFHHTLFVSNPFSAQSEIVKNGNPQAWIQGGGGAQHGASGTNSAVMELKPQEQVWVNVVVAMDGNTGGHLTTFSGYLIHAL